MDIRQYIRLPVISGSGQAEVVSWSNGHSRANVLVIEADEAKLSKENWDELKKGIDHLFEEAG